MKGLKSAAASTCHACREQRGLHILHTVEVWIDWLILSDETIYRRGGFGSGLWVGLLRPAGWTKRITYRLELRSVNQLDWFFFRRRHTRLDYTRPGHYKPGHHTPHPGQRAYVMWYLPRRSGSTKVGRVRRPRRWWKTCGRCTNTKRDKKKEQVTTLSCFNQFSFSFVLCQARLSGI